MTLLIPESNLTIEFSLNLTNLTLGSAYVFTLTSQYSHQPLEIDATVLVSNARYTTFEVVFPIGFGDSHKNGIYNYDMSTLTESLEKGLVKIITSPGGETGITNYTSTPATEERVADTFFRPNY
jgi:hypothetical protein